MNSGDTGDTGERDSALDTYNKTATAVRTVVAHGDIRNDFFQSCLPLRKLLVLRFRSEQLGAEFLETMRTNLALYRSYRAKRRT